MIAKERRQITNHPFFRTLGAITEFVEVSQTSVTKLGRVYLTRRRL